MNKILMFIIMLVKEVQKDDLMSVANDLTFKVLLAIFPFVIFLLALIGYFELDTNYLLQNLDNSLPKDVMNVITPYFIEVVEVKQPSILSTSLIFMIYSASSGFNSVIKGINKAYSQKDERNFIHVRVTSIILVIIFAIAIVVSIVMLIFNDNIMAFLLKNFSNFPLIDDLFSVLGYLITISILLFCVTTINSLSLARKTHFHDILPGSVATVVCWVVLGKGFNIYVNNFSRYSTVYGSVAGVMLLMLWLNLLCLSLLIGSEINAMLKVK